MHAVPRLVLLAAAGLAMTFAPPARAQGLKRHIPFGIAHLPLTEVPATGPGDVLAVFLTGDGGWTTLERGVSAELRGAGIPVVGFSQLWYLLHRRTPERVGEDLGRIIATYRARWHRGSVVVIGYSRGAGIVPFAVNRLPPAQRAAVKEVVLIGAEHTAGFKLGPRELFTSKPRADEVPVMPELSRLGSATLVCFYGRRESDTLCPELPAPAIAVMMPGAHHFSGRYGEIGRRIAETVESVEAHDQP